MTTSMTTRPAQRRTSALPTSALFPLGQSAIQAEAQSDQIVSDSDIQSPFGTRFAVHADPADVDLTQFRYDSALQIGVIENGRDVLPLLKHSTGKTRTNTAKQDSGANDSDTDYTED
jgi:putative ATP-grasp target RiPP